MAGNRSLFFVLMASLMLALNFIGFHESYFLRLLDSDSEMPMVMHVHAAFGFGLFIVFIVQSFLAFGNRFALHRNLGRVAAVFALILAIAGLGMIRHVAAGYIPDPSEDQVVPMLIKASSVWVSLFVEVSFVVFMGLAILLRGRSEWHKRLIYLAFVGISSPALARMGQFPVAGLSPAAFTLSSMLLLVVSLAVHDLRTRGRVHIATAAGGVAQIAGLGLCAALIPYTSIGQRVILMFQ